MRVRRNEADMSWSELARLDRLSAVLDPADTRGGKNRLIDRTHKYALGRAIGEIDGAAVLDFGCGTGRLSGWLAGRGACVAGVDATSEMVAVARQAVPEASFETIDGRTLPFADGRFDVVITAYVLQYYVGGDGGIARELARVLRSGGRFAAIEQVTQDDLGRGGPAAAYQQMFVEAGFEGVDASTIRLSDSRVVRVAQRYPALSRLPLAPWLVAREAALKSEGPLVGGRYADALFVARKR
jgi:ubiquinone/menaquinone biosynthesis C-methylase UbiE